MIVSFCALSKNFGHDLQVMEQLVGLQLRGHFICHNHILRNAGTILPADAAIKRSTEKAATIRFFCKQLDSQRLAISLRRIAAVALGVLKACA
jgi:hypothetical protein